MKISSKCQRFTNYTFVEEKTLPKEYFSPGRYETEAGLNPWSSPGAAPVWGEGYGANGGTPNGCDNEGEACL